MIKSEKRSFSELLSTSTIVNVPVIDISIDTGIDEVNVWRETYCRRMKNPFTRKTDDFSTPGSPLSLRVLRWRNYVNTC